MVFSGLIRETERVFLNLTNREKTDRPAVSRRFILLRIPRCLASDELRLRPMRILDGPSVSRGLRSGDLPEANGLNSSLSGSWFNDWWWLKKTYAVLYCIEVDSKCIGLLGLCNIDPGKRAEAGLVIFDRKYRRSGYGTKAFRLFLDSLRRAHLVRTIFVRVREDNKAAHSFWAKLGFREVERADETHLMQIAVEMKTGEAATGN